MAANLAAGRSWDSTLSMPAAFATGAAEAAMSPVSRMGLMWRARSWARALMGVFGVGGVWGWGGGGGGAELVGGVEDGFEVVVEEEVERGGVGWGRDKG
jgi:hypothetical protein